MLCSGIYKLPITINKYYLLAFIKNEIFKQQIDFLVPRGSTIRHGKTKFLECLIPIPNKNKENIVKFIELLVQAIINKEIEIKRKHKAILMNIQKELEKNQKNEIFKFEYPTVNEILKLDRMDANIYSREFKKEEFLINNYKYGFSTIENLGFSISRGQNLQVSSIGKSIQTEKYINGYYTLVLPKFLTKYGTISTKKYLGNVNKLKTLLKGDLIFGAEGNEKGRSLVIIEEQEKLITNIHGIILKQKEHNIIKGIFIKLFLDYYRDRGLIDAYAVGSNGGSLAIKYWSFLKFPNFPEDKEKEIVKIYHNADIKYSLNNISLENFLEYDTNFNMKAGIYELDKSLKYLKQKLDKTLDCIINDVEVNIKFD